LIPVKKIGGQAQMRADKTSASETIAVSEPSAYPPLAKLFA
jgi:hypothetical protein